MPVAAAAAMMAVALDATLFALVAAAVATVMAL